MRAEALEVLRRHLGLPDLQVILKNEWSSANADHRTKIREGLIEELEKHVRLTADERSRILDLQQIPLHSHVGFSITHNKQCGGFALDPQGHAMGFDIEIIDRVKENLISRVAVSKEEAERAPSAASLWVAKEAALKSLFRSGLQPNVVAEVEIGEWNLDHAIENCRLITTEEKLRNTRGCVMNLENMKLAVFAAGLN